jgi:flagellar biosynthesis protein FlhG
LVDIATKTRIGHAYLQAIEDERFESLPALVYTRGFVGEFAKQLRLDPSSVQKTYLRRLRETLAARRKEPA